jgi:N-acetylmuramoyl-L-alanine amidase
MTRTLRVGTRGPDVLRWQQFLESQGHAPGQLDGVFGAKTAKATRDFQSAHALKVDAVVGPKTYAKAAQHGLRSIRRLTNAELTPRLIVEARRLLAAHHAAPYGSEFPFEIDGIRYLGRIEEHYHPPGGARKPWGYHPGVSLFADVLPEKHVEVADEAIEPGAPGEISEAPPVAHSGVIVLDPGHGGAVTLGGSSPNNARSPSGVLEKDLTLEIATLVRDIIVGTGTGFRVELTRTTDVNVGLFDRARLARDVEADVFLSIHFNGFDGNARGVEALIRPKAAGNVNFDADHRFAKRLVEAVHEAIRPLDDLTRLRGVKESNVGVLRDDWLGNTQATPACRACLLEVEFMDVPAVDELFNVGPRAAEVRTSVAESIAKVLMNEATTVNA